jgi:hypothetical protein
MRKSHAQTIEAVGAGLPFQLSSRAAQTARDLAIAIGAQKRRAPLESTQLVSLRPDFPSLRNYLKYDFHFRPGCKIALRSFAYCSLAS